MRDGRLGDACCNEAVRVRRMDMRQWRKRVLGEVRGSEAVADAQIGSKREVVLGRPIEHLSPPRRDRGADNS